MGVGKGTTARAFAQRYAVYNIDTDDLIESKENRKVKKIFKKEGEGYFRALEQETADWLEKQVSGTLISCGGGFYKVNNLLDIGTVVLLDASFEWIYDRIISSKNAKSKLKKRPLFEQEKEARNLYEQREKAYKDVANIIVNVEGKSLNEIIEEIAEKSLSIV